MNSKSVARWIDEVIACT
uniref:Uncharacterized protein n=1 Tax=Arundo donax TaxID=35708 RepID=A0A0A8Z2P1_ARUDO